MPITPDPKYREHYILEFDDIHNTHPAVWKIVISMWTDYDYLNEPSELTGTSTPLVFKTGQNVEDKFLGIIGSEVNIGIVIEDEKIIAPDFFIQDFEHAPKVQIYKNTVIYWTGFITQDDIQYPLQTTPYEFILTASDGIGLLKAKYLELTPERYEEGFIYLMDILIQRGLEMTGLDSQINIMSSLYMTGIPNTSFPTTQMLGSLYARYELFLDENNDPVAVYDAINYIAQSFGARLFYSNNKFWLQRMEDMQSPLIRVYTFNPDGTSDSNFQFIPARIIKGEISSSDGVFANANAFVNISSGHRQEYQTVNYKFRSFMTNNEWSVFEDGEFPGWIASKWSLISQGGDGTIEAPYFCIFNGDASTDYIGQFVHIDTNGTINISCKIDMSACERMAYQVWTAKDLGDDILEWDAAITNCHVYTANNTWTVGNPGTLIGNHVYHHMINRPTNNGGILDLNISIPNPPPEDHPTPPYLTYDNRVLILFIDPDSDSGASQAKIYAVYMSKVTNDYSGESDIAKLKATSNYTDNEVKDGVFVDSYDTIANSLFYKDDDDNMSVNNFDGIWKSDYGQAGSIQQFNMSSRLNQNHTAYRILQADIFSNTLLFENVLSHPIGNEYIYLQMYDEYDVRHCIHHMHLAEIKKTGKFDENTNILYSQKYLPADPYAPKRI